MHFRDGKDILRVLREARHHQEQKIHTYKVKYVKQRLPQDKKTKPIRKYSRKASKKSD
jgi:hypothetical protein